MAPSDPDDPGVGGPDEPVTPPFRPPLPPEDRIWRHPSEVAQRRNVAAAAPPSAERDHGRLVPRTAALMLVSAMVGATLAVGVVALAGGFDERIVERRVAVSPVTSTVRRADGPAVVAERTASSVAAVDVGGDHDPASAVVVRSDGHLVTALAALPDDATTGGAVDVHLPDASVEPGVVVTADELTGLALVHVDRDDLVPAALGDTGALATGDAVLTVGAVADGGWSPVGTDAMVAGVGLSLRHDQHHWHDLVVLDGAHRTSAAGAAVADGSGAVVGLVVGVADGLAAVVPAEVASVVIDDLLTHGRARHAWLGVEGRDGDATTGAGAVIESLFEDGPAWSGGLAAGDLIVAIDDSPVASMTALIGALRRQRPGDEIVLTVRRATEDVTVTCRLGERPTSR